MPKFTSYHVYFFFFFSLYNVCIFGSSYGEKSGQSFAPSRCWYQIWYSSNPKGEPNVRKATLQVESVKELVAKRLQILHISPILKFGFSEKAAEFEKNLCRTFDKSVLFCARNNIVVKKLTKIFF